MTLPLDGRRGAPLIEQALVHDSYAAAHGCEHNERLEFLGDAVLQFLVSERLYAAHPSANEGTLHLMRKTVVSNHHLAKVSELRGVAPEVRVKGDLEVVDRSATPDVYAAAYEAVLGAIFLEEGLEAARVEVQQALGEDIDAGRIERDPLNRLQEWHQRRHGTTPAYTVVGSTGQGREARHTVRLDLPAEQLSFQSAASRIQTAKRRAAEEAVDALVALGEIESS